MRPRPWLKVMLSLCVIGLLVGLMIGRLVNPPGALPNILAVEPSAEGLALLLDAQPTVRAGQLDGALALRIEARAKAQRGQLRIEGAPVRWTLEPQDGGVLLTLLSTRRLRGTWSGVEEDGRWRLEISARPE